MTIVATDLTRPQALAMEKEYIAAIGRHDLGKGPLANLTDGGDGGSGVVATEEQRKNKRRASLKMHAERSARRAREIYSKTSASQKAYLAGLSLDERKARAERNRVAKEASIRRIHRSYVNSLFSTLRFCPRAYRSYSKIRELVPSIPKCTLAEMLRQYAASGTLIASQKGANQPKHYKLA